MTETKRFILATEMAPDSALIQALEGCEAVERIVYGETDLLSCNDSRIVLVSWSRLLRREFVGKQQMVLNVHNSLLPKYRGLHAFTWALIHGEDKVGYSLHEVTDVVDGGPVYEQCKITVGPEDDINSVFANADNALCDWLPDVLSRVWKGTVRPIPQAEHLATRFPRRTLSDMEISGEWDRRSIRDFVRAHRPPYTKGAFLEIGRIRYHLDHVISSQPTSSAGQLPVRVNEEVLRYPCSDGAVDLLISSEDTI